MYFADDDLMPEIIGVYKVYRENKSWYSPKRNFSVLSFHFCGKTEIIYKGTTYKISKNNLIYIPENIEYYQYSENNLLMPIHFKENCCRSDEIEIISENGEYAKTFKVISELWLSGSARNKFKALSMIYMLFSRLAEFSQSEEGNKIGKAISFIKTNCLCSDLTVADVAEHVGISEAYLRKLIKKELGMSPIKYIIYLRVEAAKKMLESGFYSVAEVARLCGFEDAGYFSSVFKRYACTAPSEYGRRIASL